MLLAFPVGEAVTVDIPILQTRTFISTYTHYRPYELRLLIFPQSLGGALKNQNAAPTTPPCIPLFVALRHLPPAGGVFGRRPRLSSLLFESTLLSETFQICKRKTPVYFYTSVLLVGAGGFEPPKLKSSRFTVCPHWPLGNTPKFNFQSSLTACISYHFDSALSTTFCKKSISFL